MSQAIDRISYLIKNEPDRKVVFLTGAGISLPQIPSVVDLIDLFLKELGNSRSEVYKRINAYSDNERYQAAAQELKQRRGERSLAAAIQKAVLRALGPHTDAQKRNDYSRIEPTDWVLPPAQQLLGKLVAKIPAQQRGAIITTNFDPLTEAALEVNGVRATTLATPGNQAFPIDNVYGGMPVVHLHGYWATTATLSTSMHLNTERPNIERMIGRTLEKAVVVVLGYGGWEDSFTRALVKTITEGYMSSLDSELLWLQYGGPEKVAGHSLLSQIKGEAGVNLYCHIDAETLIKGVLDELGSFDRISREAYLGWDVPSPLIPSLSRSDFQSFFNGAYPTIGVAAQMPRLENTRLVREEIKKLMSNSGDAAFLVSSPAGEGKSTALLQTAQDMLEEYPMANIIIRRPGAPKITSNWLTHLRREHEITVAFIDDADLVIEEIYESYRDEVHEEEKGFHGKILWVLAAHTSYADTAVSRRLAKVITKFEQFEFRSVISQDIAHLIDVWEEHDALPPVLANLDRTTIESKILAASQTLNEDSSLFGSILTFWSGAALKARVGELLKKLERQQISGVSFRDLLAYVAVTQHAWRKSGAHEEGLSLVAFGRFANVNDSDVTRILVRPLGREVGLSQIGSKVLVRHPAIAEAIYDIYVETKELNEIVQEISRQGAILRFDPESYDEDSYAAYRLARRLPGDASIRAAIGAIEGADKMLEPRVTLLATLRGNGDFEKASTYACRLEAHLQTYEDYSRAARGFYVEWSNIEASEGRLDSALRLAIKSLSDEIDARLTGKQIEYAVACIKRYADRLAATRRVEASELYEAALDILRIVPTYKLQGHEQALTTNTTPTEVLTRFREATRPFTPGQAIRFVRMTRHLSSLSPDD